MSDTVGDETEDLKSGQDSIFATRRYLELFQPETDILPLIHKTKERSFQFWYELGRRSATLFTRAAQIDSRTIEGVAEELFDRHPNVSQVIFPHTFVGGSRARFGRILAYPTVVDVATSLPPTVDEFKGRLGHSTRRNLTKYLNRLIRDFPDARFTVTVGSQVSEDLFNSLLEMSKSRLRNKGLDPALSDLYTQRLKELVRSEGAVFTWEDKGGTLGGALSSQVGDQFFLHVIAHDPKYDYYRIGHCVIYSSMLWAIERRYSHYHFLWGRFTYKYHFLGETRQLSNTIVFRDSVSLWIHAWPHVVQGLGFLVKRAAESELQTLLIRFNGGRRRNPGELQG